MTSGFRDIEIQLLTTRTSIGGKRLRVEMSGCLDMDTTPHLKAYLDPLLLDFKAGIVSEFEFDMSQLYLMSSASISCFAVWIKTLKGYGLPCTVKFRTNPNLGWQQRTLDPIRRLAEDIVSID